MANYESPFEYEFYDKKLKELENKKPGDTGEITDPQGKHGKWTKLEDGSVSITYDDNPETTHNVKRNADGGITSFDRQVIDNGTSYTETSDTRRFNRDGKLIHEFETSFIKDTETGLIVRSEVDTRLRQDGNYDVNGVNIYNDERITFSRIQNGNGEIMPNKAILYALEKEQKGPNHFDKSTGNLSVMNAKGNDEISSLVPLSTPALFKKGAPFPNKSSLLS